MKKFLLIALVASAFIMACGQAEQAAEKVTAKVPHTLSEVTITDGTPVTTADLSISGMTCEMMCGGAVKKCLAGLPGIAGTEIKMVDGDAPDHAIVTFDPGKVDDSQMIEAIQKLNDGQYKVLAVSITKQVKQATTTTEDEAAPVAKKDEVSALLPEMVLPGLFELLSRIVRF